MEWLNSLSYEFLITLLIFLLPILIIKHFLSVRNHRISIKKKALLEKFIEH